MSVIVEVNRIRLTGRCGVEDAEALLTALQANPAYAIDLADCRTLHTSIVQVLLVSRSKIIAEPVELALRRWLLPLLASGGQAFELLPDGIGFSVP
ncbi:hypothetical protein ACELLULO517_25670 [Acidisoma cellulosilytica]|uniref:STAS domain-containing protein n=1 Tax=Acidisoma cellulosilyticum TaxID=2802395 RepID=A0A964E6J9_9PROT|nr:hypothetical protein [Acidisoma cellulosilyticum]MCB8883664.1 hypothetical protein [Acidisoma cellulosilyticum]